MPAKKKPTPKKRGGGRYLKARKKVRVLKDLEYPSDTGYKKKPKYRRRKKK